MTTQVIRQSLGLMPSGCRNMSKFADFINDELDPPVSIGFVRKYQSLGLKGDKYQMLLGKKKHDDIVRYSRPASP
jgi:hypothetical protein